MILILSFGSAQPRPVAVFWGDSISAGWDVSNYFPQFTSYNAGVGGQDTDHILARWQVDVAAHHPTLVIIEAGVNDLYFHRSAAHTLTNLQTMIDLARSIGARPVLSSLVPISNELWHTHIVQSEVLALNAQMRLLAERNGIAFADYYDVLTRQMTIDGLHPNAIGYTVMREVLLKAD